MSKHVTDTPSTRPIGVAQSAIIILVVSAAAIHFGRAVANPHITVLFTLNGLGYLGLLALLFLPMASSRRGLISNILIGYTALTFVLFFLWGFMKGEWPLIGFVCVAIEAAIIALLWRDNHA